MRLQEGDTVIAMHPCGQNNQVPVGTIGVIETIYNQNCSDDDNFSEDDDYLLVRFEGFKQLKRAGYVNDPMVKKYFKRGNYVDKEEIW